MPNDAHRFVAEWQRRYKTITQLQNVDNLLERAGCTDVIHPHGHVQKDDLYGVPDEMEHRVSTLGDE